MNYLSGPIARGPSGRPPKGAAGSGTPCGAGEEGQEEGHGYSEEFPFQVLSDDDSEADSSHKGEEEKKKASPRAGGGKKRKASLTKEA